MGVYLGEYSACAGILAAAHTLDDNGDLLVDAFEMVTRDIEYSLTDETRDAKNNGTTDMIVDFDFRVDMTAAM
jgi:hypothetical protein